MLQKKGKVGKTISFDPFVLECLVKRCKSVNTTVSNFVNYHMRTAVVGELGWAHSMAKFHAGETAKWRMEMEHLEKKR